MKITFKKIDDCNGKLVVNVEEADYAAKVDEELKKIGKTHNIPGFRKGHINIVQLRTRFGKQVKSDVLNNEIYEAAVKHIIDNKINILGQPIPSEMMAINLEDKDYTFTYDLGLAPEINVVVDKTVTLPYYQIEITDKMIEEQDKSLCERFGSQVPGEEVDEKAVVKGSIMELNPDGSVKETEDAVQVLNGVVAPFYFKSKEEAQKFIGKKVNDKVVFNPYASCEGNTSEMASMLNIAAEKANEYKGDFEMSISEIIVVKLADHNQDFYDSVFGRDKVHNEEDYKNALKAMIEGSFRGNTDYYFNVEARKFFMDKYGDEIKLPDAFLKRWLKMNNPKAAENTDWDKEYELMIPQIKWQLINDRITDKLSVKIEEEDVEARAKYIAHQQFAQYGIYNMDDETLKDTAKRILADKNYRRRITEEVSELKLFASVKEAVNIDLKTVSIDEFVKMANPSVNSAE